MNTYLEKDIITKHSYDIGGYDTDKLVCIKEEQCIIHSDGHIYTKNHHHLCNKWYHKPTYENNVSSLYRDEHILSLIQVWNNSFQHITFDTLPKLPLIQKLIEKDTRVKILVMNKIQRNMLHNFGGIPLDRFIIRDYRCSYIVKVGYYINYINSKGESTRMGSSGYKTLTNFVQEESIDSKCKYVCYISRRNQKLREVDHQDETNLIKGLQHICLENGFKLKIFINPKDPDELRTVLKDTTVFVSPHGGAMGNIIWLNKNSHIIEVIPKKGLEERPCFYYLANALGLKYSIFEPNEFDFNKNCISIDVDKLIECVKCVITPSN